MYVVDRHDLQDMTVPTALSRKRKGKASSLLTEDDDDEHHEILYNILETVQDIKASTSKQLQQILDVSKEDKIPLGLRVALTESYKCKICLRLAKSPIMMSTCCGQLIGCEVCTNTWYSGPAIYEKTCPACRADRGVSKLCRLRGMDSVIDIVRKIADGDMENGINMTTSSSLGAEHDTDDELPEWPPSVSRN